MPVRAPWPVVFLLAAQLALPSAPRAGEVGYPSVIAGQLAAAMDLSREEGKALEGATLTVELDLDSGGAIRDAVIVAIDEARTPEDREAARVALEDAFDRFRARPFTGLDPDDEATWGHMRLVFQIGLHVGGYQP
ncbi:MAG: hypothetical protein O2825_11280 [Proteobacteria bacterium]|nr:hypothetical protein [Pseudomonadota bacterium]